MRKDRPLLDTIITKEFQRFLKKLSRKGGEADFIYMQVMGALSAWERNEDAKLPLTNHGENRVPNAVKYDLKGYYRLVVYEHAGLRIPLMVGNHDETDQWLESNRGRDFTTNRSSANVEYTVTLTDRETTKALTESVEPVEAAKGPILDRLPRNAITALGLSEVTLSALNAFATFEEVDGERLWTLVAALPFPSEQHRGVVTQAIALTAGGFVDKAVARITLFLDEATTATKAPDAFAAAVEGDENSEKMIKLSQITTAELDRVNKIDGFTDWMLYLHPDQRKLVDRDYTGPARLLGVSGSGKTTVLIHRAFALAKKYSQEPVLIVTLNPALTNLISHLVTALCPQNVLERIQVTSIYEFCYSVVKTISPNDLIERHDPKSGETLEMCWKDFLAKPHASQSISKIMNVLEERESNIDSAGYILDELIWIRSGFGKGERARYLMSDRPGRGIPLPKFDDSTASSKPSSGDKEFPADTRKRLLNLLADYEEYMKDGGLMDEDGVSLEAYSVKHRIKEFPALRARCVLVDEVQDCSTVQLAVLAEVPTDPENGLFMTGDPVQKVFAKQQDLLDAGIELRGSRASVLRTNYRNTRQILEAAYAVINKYRDLAPVPPGEVLEPEYALKEGTKPKLYECRDQDEQLRLVIAWLSWMPQDEHDGVCICSASEASLAHFAKNITDQGWSVHRISGQSGEFQTISNGVKLCLMRDIKGYEFQYVFLIDLIDSIVYPKGMPWDERWRVAFQLYVAMTRARKELVMSFINNRSYFLQMNDLVQEQLASEVVAT